MSLNNFFNTHVVSPIHLIYSQTSEIAWSVNPGRERKRSDVSRRFSVALAASLACKLMKINIDFSNTLSHFALCSLYITININFHLPICY